MSGNYCDIIYIYVYRIDSPFRPFKEEEKGYNMYKMLDRRYILRADSFVEVREDPGSWGTL